MSIFEELTKKALDDEYFKELFCKAELCAASNFFQVQNKKLEEKEFVDLLRFADILSRSSDDDAKNKSYKIISLLIDDYGEDDLFKNFANSVLIKLGNFPAIKFFEEHSKLSTENQSFELILERCLKEVYQKIPGNELVFTDAQYEIFESLKKSNHFSFSGPTSLGKSFILNAFIQNIIIQNNAHENIIILVPTRALINQISSYLKQEFSSVQNCRILCHPTVPKTFDSEDNRYIFVFTPERLISYLSDSNNPRIGYLFVDEAHKVVAEQDSRSPLYYHSILQAERKSIKLYFASPNIPNPEVFLKIFEKSTDESLNIKSSPVAQNRYFLDLVDKHCILFSDINKEQNIKLNFSNKTFNDWLNKLSAKQASIIYCNTKADTIQFALDFSRNLPCKDNEKINELISVIKDHLHKKYFLIDCLKKGVAFHFGNLPQRIRSKVESLFVEKVIDYVFCTSTLLEGVNLPAKNIFILNNAIGMTHFTDIDFWNLAGRAGRLSKELSGNIICTRIENKRNRWKNPKKDLTVVKEKKIKPIKPLVISGKKNFYSNVEAALTGSEFTRKNISSNEKNILNHYANIALIHEIRSDDSALRSNFISKNENARSVLQEMKKEIAIPARILSSYSVIKARYQNKIYQRDDLEEYILSLDICYESILSKLKILCDFYSWDQEEASGRNPMYRTRDSLKYYAVLMSSWMNSTPLSRMISASIKYYRERGEIWNGEKLVPFYDKNQPHINMVINEIITNIDNILRFKLKNYFGNYYEILVEKLGKDKAGKNWGEFLEYGTTDFRIIELQNIGIPRHLANYLLEQYKDFFEFENNILISFDREKLLDDMDSNSVELKELLEVI
ncbi:MAG: DEAD/DEAH box helicase [Candidatus Electrothrix sp. AW5]|nr:DEAD/DEAH box helicase [Candidatus Electrothrix gigas]